MTVDVANWLQPIGLAQYAAAFRENDVDGDVLPDLTAEDFAWFTEGFDTHDLRAASALLDELEAGHSA